MIAQNLAQLHQEIQTYLRSSSYTLVAVSKNQPLEKIQQAYQAGHRHFGENYVQELIQKYHQLPKDIHWHCIGALQTNKVKYIAPFIHLIHTLDRKSLCDEIQKQAKKYNRIIPCLIQVAISPEETKVGGCQWEEFETLYEYAKAQSNIKILGLMGMASFTQNEEIIRKEFQSLAQLYRKYPEFSILSMGMSSDYLIALQEGANMLRIGTKIFGERK
ncbi:MAG: YggS family pyridoxal phosphate-dependent enzyme [Bacteroidia bacterium]|nr:YggS family pyridoxal phosphate-dependent enzyme [Bacteroidia bacterium]MDW8301015.1 YggS family pyridoxal phosphate-dependent enzyme [Bacteroidia bacterium]